MRIALILLIFLVSCNEGTKTGESAATESRHSQEFNNNIQQVLGSYYAMTEAFVNYDSTAIPNLASKLQQKITTLRPAGSDSTAANYVSQSQRYAGIIAESNSMEEKRHALHSLSESLFEYLKAVEYDREKLYFQECPMAFNDTESGYWLAAGDSIRNPYLGRFHPKYGRSMLKCGENKEVIDHLENK